MIRKTLIFFVLLIFLVSTASAATLDVGQKAKYKSIQSAVTAAKNGDTIRVAAGTYKENVVVNSNKHLIFIGEKGKYPTVYSFTNTEQGGTFDINGFKITSGITETCYATSTPSLIRNNYFMNCGIQVAGQIGSFNIMNNQFIGSKTGIRGYDTYFVSVTGNQFTKCSTGFYGYMMSYPTVSKNTFTQCGIAVDIYDVQLSGFTGNKYIKNTKNIVVRG